MDKIFLIGYMGSGKTTMGKILADKLGYNFIDIDTHIESKMCKSVSQIFADHGESEFRLLEQKCLHEVSEFEKVVIATGGGTPCFFDNMDFMNARGLTLYIQLTPRQLTDRLLTTQLHKRPLLKDKNEKELLEFITEGLAAREPFYLKAAEVITGTDDEIALLAYEAVKKY